MDRVAGPIRRFFAYVVDCSVVFFFFQLLLSHKLFLEFLEDCSHFLDGTLLQNHASAAVNIIAFLFIVTQWRFLFTFLFGESLGQFLMGIYGAGGHFWKRVGGSARVQLELLLYPVFILSEAPTLFRQRSLKEYLTLTALRSAGQLRFFFSFFFLLPLFLFLATISPLLQDYQYLMGMPIKASEVMAEELTTKSDFSKFTTFRSESFKFSTLSSLDNGKFMVIPSFSIEKHNGEDLYLPVVYFYDRTRKKVITMQQAGQMDLYQILGVGRNYNPLFFARYPELSIALAKDKSIYNLRTYRSEYGNRGILSKQVLQEEKELLESSLSLGLRNISDHVMDQGPFIKGSVDLRTELLHFLNLNELEYIEMVKLGDQRHLIFHGKSKVLDGESVLREYLVGIESFSPRVLSLSAAMDGKESLDDLRNDFFSSSSWFYDYNDIFSPPMREDDLDPIMALDYLGDSRLKADKRKIVEDYLYHHFFDLCKYAVSKKDEQLIFQLLIALNRHIIMSSKLWDKNLIGRDYVSFMQALKVSVKNRDRRYFGL